MWATLQALHHEPAFYTQSHLKTNNLRPQNRFQFAILPRLEANSTSSANLQITHDFKANSKRTEATSRRDPRHALP